MNLFYLRYFVTLARVQQYTKAAEQLCIAQPSLSHAISQLEKELGLPLFEKSGRKTTLTRFGEEFLVCAEHTLATLDSGVESLRRSARGDGLIRLGFLRPLGVEFIPRLAAEFLQKQPDANVQFSFHTGVSQSLLDGLAARKFDLVFCSEPSPKLGLTAVPVQRQEARSDRAEGSSARIGTQRGACSDRAVSADILRKTLRHTRRRGADVP